MNVVCARLTGAFSVQCTKRPLLLAALSLSNNNHNNNNSPTTAQRRWLASFGASSSSSSSSSDESPLDFFLEPGAPTPLYNSTEFIPPPPPKLLECGVDESALRFKTTCYGRLLQAPFVHPNEHKIVLSVPMEDLHLNALERDIMKEIVGTGRWREDRGELRLQSVSFGSRIENKRHLVSMLDRLVLSCQRLAAEVQQQQEGGGSEEFA